MIDPIHEFPNDFTGAAIEQRGSISLNLRRDLPCEVMFTSGLAINKCLVTLRRPIRLEIGAD